MKLPTFFFLSMVFFNVFNRAHCQTADSSKMTPEQKIVYKDKKVLLPTNDKYYVEIKKGLSELKNKVRLASDSIANSIINVSEMLTELRIQYSCLKLMNDCLTISDLNQSNFESNLTFLFFKIYRKACPNTEMKRSLEKGTVILTPVPCDKKKNE